ncbi:MAG: caspase domain-containing protein [Pyrinomonadaceae bacterium]
MSVLLLVVAPLVCALGASAQPAHTQPAQPAQDRGIRRDIEAQAGHDNTRALGLVQTLPSRTKRYALVIGIDQYTDPQVVGLGGAANDARLLADSLVHYAGFPADQVVLLASGQTGDGQPTRGNILRKLSNLAAVVPKDGLLLFSFAGHGVERNNQAFLLPADAQVSDDVNLLEQTAINVLQIKDWIRKTGVGQVLLLLDACRNDPSAGRSAADNPLTKNYMRGFDFDVRNREVQAFATLYATEIGQRAYERNDPRHGYFTLALVDGLKGQAANAKGEVTLAGLVSYMQNTVPPRVLLELGQGKLQKPYAVIEGYRADELVLSLKDPKAKGIEGMSGNGPVPPPPPPSADALVGTVWTGVNPTSGEFTVQFLDAGQLLYLVDGVENGKKKVFSTKGKWQRAGKNIRITIGDSYSVWTGTIDNDAMKGTGSNQEGEKWEWSLFKKTP